MHLPIDSYLPQIAEALRGSEAVVVQASPGSGKTTRLPPHLMSLLKGNEEIWVLEPRRLAAKMAAFRISQELGKNPGDLVGYHFRFENSTSPATRVLFLTEGMFVRRLLGDLKLSRVKILVLDEFHERSLSTDIAISTARRLQKTTRPDLKIVVMSATMAAEKVADFLGGCPIFQIEAPQYPVTIDYLSEKSDSPLEDLVRKGVRQAFQTSAEGDVLVFLPGMREIRRSESELLNLKKTIPLSVFALHGELSREEQEAALRPAKSRKVILSTNIAETSLTIEGVSTVIDSGLQRSASYSHWSGISRLSTKAISKASAIQRAGRAGRLGPGKCIRLYPQGDFENRAPFEVPEIMRADLSQTCLEILRLGATEVTEFPWYEAPPKPALDAALALLVRLGAIKKTDRGFSLTEEGIRISELPLHPRVGKFLLEAERLGVVGHAISVAAAMSEGELPTDILDSRGQVSHTTKRLENQLASYFKKSSGHGPRELLAQALLFSFPDRVGRTRKNPKGEWEIVLCEGGSARVDTGHLEEGMFAVVVDVSETKLAKSTVRWVRALAWIEPEWLLEMENGVSYVDEFSWDNQRKKVRSVSRVTYGQLVLEEKDKDLDRGPGAFRVLVENGIGVPWQTWSSATPDKWLDIVTKFSDKEMLETELSRALLFLGKEQWELLRKGLDEGLSRCASAAELQAVDWPELILGAVPPSERDKLETSLPSHLALPSGRRARVQYRLDRDPWVESRIQDFFGMKDVPRILGGKLAITLHLLAPNQRAVQVTRDLKGFWERDYERVRNELKRRYPRHDWPEKPERGSK